MPRRKPVRPWSAADLKTLRRLAGRQSTRTISRELKRSEGAVRFKAWAERIKLRRPPVARVGKLATKARR
jgi:hypothetical protein